MFLFFLPNVVNSWNSTMFQTTIPMNKEKGSLSNSIKGITFLIIFQSNFYQLAAIAVVRLLDIVFPWKRLSEGKTHVILISVWLLAIVSSTIPSLKNILMFCSFCFKTKDLGNINIIISNYII